MIELEINGRAIQARDGAMLIDAADEAGIAIPRFCYHKKLSIAANCRMCLVEIDKSPKPMPACSIPATDGMKVFTNSPKAIMAQKGVMEFLLINHPLDCPICDQGGECELQDVAMGYGRSLSRYQEKKRVVKDKDLGPLISTDMTRCIHCTRCVRFGQEIAGLMELGATGRGEHMEIGTYIQKNMVSELSGNVIDLCPVGALTSKPFRYTARAWEMTQHETVAPHDSIGSNLHVHVRGGRVQRVVPCENEDINETWISDRDRFSYEGLNSEDRLPAPMLRQDGVWREVDWKTALDATVQGLKKVIASDGAGQLGALVSPTATLEEMYLLQKLLRGIGCNNIDHRLRQTDFAAQQQAPLFPKLGLSIAGLEHLEAALIIGSNLRSEQPIAAHRLRKAAMRGSDIMFVNPLDYELHFNISEKIISSPDAMAPALAGIAKALIQLDDATLESAFADVEVGASHIAIARKLRRSDNATVLLGNLAVAHPQYSVLRALAVKIAELSGASFSELPDSANSAGAWLAGVLPHRAAAGELVAEPGLSAHAMLDAPLKAYVLLGLEPELDCSHPDAALSAMRSAQFVVSLSTFRSEIIENYADVMLPIAAFVETSGTFVNAEGSWQSFTGAVPPQNEARPAWKILRVLGNLFNVDGFDYISSEQVRDELRRAVDAAAIQPVASAPQPLMQKSLAISNPIKGLTRIAEVPAYASDALVRRATALQQTARAQAATIHVNPALAVMLNLAQGDMAIASQDGRSVTLPVMIDVRVPNQCVLIPAGLPQTAVLGASFGPIELERKS